MVGDAIAYGFSIFAKILAFVTVIAFVAVLYIIFTFNSRNVIKVNKPITPEIELIIKDNKVDTLYIYKKPK